MIPLRSVTLFLILIITLSCSRVKNPAVSAGTLLQLNNYKSKYVKPRNISVWLPPAYTPSKKYPVLYMQDGMSLFDTSITWNHKEWLIDETISKLLKDQKISPCIVVGIWNGTSSRHSEYMPQKPFEEIAIEKQNNLYNATRPNQSLFFSEKVKSDEYLKFITLELKHLIDSSFSTLPDQQNTFIAGSSMGGLISLYALCEYPLVFGGAACLSTHWTGIYTNQDNQIPQAICAYLDKNTPSSLNHKIYFDHGTESLDSLYKPTQLKVDSIFASKGYSTNLVSLEFQGKDHSESAWSERIHIPLLFLLGNERK